MRNLAIGLMSGTSADGVSLALCQFDNRKRRLLGFKTYSYPSNLRGQILTAVNLKTPAISQLNFSLGHFFADSVNRFLNFCRTRPTAVAVIGSHGQTIYHGPKDNPVNTFQIGEPSVIAEKTGIMVVADFRPRDIAAGGSGAPLVPFFEREFLRAEKFAAFQNIGGIANVTVVGAKIKPIAFDAGPGNCLIDLVIQKHSRGKLAYDKNGALAARGWVNPKVVRELIDHPYFLRRPPKSTGRELFNLNFIPKILWKEPIENQMATLTYFTAHSISESYKRFIPHPIAEVIVSGGGAENKTLMRFLKSLLAPIRVSASADYGIPSQAREPMAFAYFAWLAVHGKVNHLPAVTGAKRACVLGKIIPGKY